MAPAGFHAALLSPQELAMPQQTITRRKFIETGAVATTAALTAAQTSKVLGANDRVRLGFLGTANRGMQLIAAFLENSDVEVAALCDISQSTLEKAGHAVGGKPVLLDDFRKLLDRTDIDAVVVATPDHWHALQTIAACRAGKDVYVEKPLSQTIHEGRRMVEVARQTKQVVQVGLHRRSSTLYADAAKFIQGEKLGRVTISRCYHISNMYPSGIGRAKPSAPPADLNWDMWLGPRPMRPYQDNIVPYKFRWWQLYSSQIGNNGVHFLDLIRWMTGDLAPKRIAALGGRYAVDDDRTIPDTMEAMFESPAGRLTIFGQYEASGNPPLPQPGFIEVRGTQGTAYVDDSVMNVIPEKGGQFQDHRPRMAPIKLTAGSGKPGKGNRNLSLTAQHARNFIDCMRSRELPHCDVEIGHRSTSYANLANIALAAGAQLDWDAKREVITNHPKANELLHYEYRKPWSLD
jgi:predicted dehydrogenase